MYKNQMLGLLSSYFNARSAILRALGNKPLSNEEFKNKIALKRESLNKRRRNPEKWQTNEISKLAELLQIGGDPAYHLMELNKYLQSMEYNELHQLLKDALITKTRGISLLNDSSKWNYLELTQLKTALERLKEVPV